MKQTRGADIMTPWIIIIFAYVIIAVGVFNMVSSDYLHPLF
jgi:hypothetical protein